MTTLGEALQTAALLNLEGDRRVHELLDDDWDALVETARPVYAELLKRKAAQQ